MIEEEGGLQVKARDFSLALLLQAISSPYHGLKTNRCPLSS